MDDILTNAQKIDQMIQQIEELICTIDEMATDKSNGIANYDRELAITILRLKNKDITEFEGNKIDNLPATILPIIAKGIIYKAAFDKEIGDAGYKAIITKIEARKSQLNGLQSINKHLD